MMKYPHLKKSPDTVEDILFRLKFSPTSKGERNVGRVLAVFEKPFATLNMDPAIRVEFTDLIAQLKSQFDAIRVSPKNRSLHKGFWVIWRDFDTVLHKIGKRSAVSYCVDLIHNSHQQIIEAIEQIATSKPITQLEALQDIDASAKMSAAFRAVDDRFREIVASPFPDVQKIPELEAMRRQVRQFKTDISAAFLSCFAIPSMSRSRHDPLKNAIEKCLSAEIAAISDLRRQASLIESLDEFIEQSLKTVTRLIKGQPLSTPQENVNLTSPFCKSGRKDVSQKRQIRAKTERPKNDNLVTPRKVRIGGTKVIGLDPLIELIAESSNPLIPILQEMKCIDSPLQLPDSTPVTPKSTISGDSNDMLELNGALIRFSMLLNVALSYNIKKPSNL
jgi:hypothetical protein